MDPDGWCAVCLRDEMTEQRVVQAKTAQQNPTRSVGPPNRTILADHQEYEVVWDGACGLSVC